MKIDTYLKKNKINPSEFARLIGVSPMAVHRYIVGRLPAPDVMCAIHKLTKGEVAPNDFYELWRKR